MNHLTNDLLLGFMHGTLRSDDVTAVVQHLETCDRCADDASSSAGVTRATSSLMTELQPDERDHPEVETVLTSFVDGTLDRAEAAAVKQHLEGCATCRADVADLREVADQLRGTSSSKWLWLAAAAAVIAIIAGLAGNRAPVAPAGRSLPARVTTPARTTTESPLRYERPEWNAVVADALRAGKLERPTVLAGLQLAADPERAAGRTETGALQPAGVVIETTRPTFQWTGRKSERYVVSVFDGPKVVFESPVLSEPKWHPERSLPRGRVYQWQVELQDGSGRVIPAPPAPPAVFRVLDEASMAELEDARRAHPDDRLLLGALYASNGLREEAERELSALATPQGRALLRSVQAWPAPERRR
jgi:anti-sigma factor RsiW